MSIIKSAFWTVFWFFMACVIRSVHAEERHVVNGTILHTGEFKDSSEASAVFRAEALAIKAVILECSMAHREIRVYKRDIEKQGSEYVVKIQAGIPFSDCEEAKQLAGTPQAKRVENPALVANQKTLDELTRRDLGIDKSPVSGIERGISKLTEAIQGRFSKTDERLDEQQDEIDELRGAIQEQQAAEAARPRLVTEEAPRVASNPNRQICQSQAQALLAQARAASMTNFPPGNMAQGAAQTYYNQAQMVLASCN